jgi:hypothetical protein
VAVEHETIRAINRFLLQVMGGTSAFVGACVSVVVDSKDSEAGDEWLGFWDRDHAHAQQGCRWQVVGECVFQHELVVACRRTLCAQPIPLISGKWVTFPHALYPRDPFD